MPIGSTMMFRGEKDKVMRLYDNGTFEIKEKDSLGRVELLSLSDHKIFEKIIKSC